jgi:hypothetical protein
MYLEPQIGRFCGLFDFLDEGCYISIWKEVHMIRAFVQDVSRLIACGGFAIVVGAFLAISQGSLKWLEAQSPIPGLSMGWFVAWSGVAGALFLGIGWMYRK